MSRSGNSKYQLFLVWCCLLASLPAQEQQPQTDLGDARTFPDDYPGTLQQRPQGNTEANSSLPDLPFFDFSFRKPQSNSEVALSIRLLLFLTLITISPTLLLLLTCFLRLAIVFDFIRRALTLQQSPPTSVLMGLALFLSLFIMWPVLSSIYQQAYRPLNDNQIDLNEFYQRSKTPLKKFMFAQLAGDTETLELFIANAGITAPKTLADVPLQTLIPAYVLHELKVAFRIGILIYLPFVVIDIVIASILISMGMIMLPPVMIAMPFKLILFVLVGGWDLLARQLIESVRINMAGLGF